VGALRWLAAATIFFLASPAAAQVDRWSDYIAEASLRFRVPEAWIRRVMRAESGGRTMLHGRPITSRAGATGLMQLMPGTWREMRAAYRLGLDPHEPRDNILAGTAYLRLMYDRFGYPGLFAAYNAGPARYARSLATGQRLPAETIAYVATVAGGRPGGPAAAPARGPNRTATLFAARSGREVSAMEEPPPPPSNPLFVQLTTAAAPPQ
jgi:soluble lytic murein transglycosylase-like protein